MSDKINIKDLPFMQQLFAKLCDKDGNGVLEKTSSCDEVSLFLKLTKSKTKFFDSKNSIFTEQYTAAQDAIPDTRKDVIPMKAIPSKAKTNAKEEAETPLQNTSDMIIKEAETRNVKLSPEDIKYWAEKADMIAKEYNIPVALLISIIGQETNGKFNKNINSINGAGPMQIVEVSVRDFFPGAKGSWHDIYKSMNEELLNDILYEKDKDGNFIKNDNGEYVLKYKSAKELRNACAKDDSLGMKVGLLCFEMKYVKAVAAKKYGRATYGNVPKIIKGIQDSSIILNENENKSAIEIALKNYNSVFKSYAGTVIDSLEMHGVNFQDLYFIKQ